MTVEERAQDLVIADDDHEDVKIFELALVDAGKEFEIRHATDAEHLFVLLKDKLPYMLFLDIHLPLMDGADCLRTIRKNPTFDHLPIVMFTSNNHPSLISKTYDSGANLFLQKPYTYKELVDNLRRIFEKDWSPPLMRIEITEFVL